MAQCYRIAVTGHRNLGDSDTVQFVAHAFQLLLAQAQQAHPAGVVALFGVAAGADMLFAEAALALGIPLDAVIAYEGFIADFPPGPLREQYLHLLAHCRNVSTLPFRQRSDAAYMAVGCRLADNCDLMLAAWNGQPAAGHGGTGDVVAYARYIGRPVIHIDTTRHSIRHLPARMEAQDRKRVECRCREQPRQYMREQQPEMQRAGCLQQWRNLRRVLNLIQQDVSLSGLTQFFTWRCISPPAGRNRPPFSRNFCTACKNFVKKIIAYHAAADESGHSFQSNVRFARPPRKS
jgi:hypothetical protein